MGSKIENMGSNRENMGPIFPSYLPYSSYLLGILLLFSRLTCYLLVNRLAFACSFPFCWAHGTHGRASTER